MLDGCFSRADCSTAGLDQSPCKRFEPSPPSSQDPSAAINQFINVHVACDERCRKGTGDCPGGMHANKDGRRNTSTSLVWREQTCAKRINAHATEFLTIQDPPGYPRRGS